MIATSITSEKSNRAIEVLVTTVDSTSLIFGKVIAGAISGIFQAGVILGSGLIAYHFCGAGWDYRLDFLFHIPAEVWAAFIVFRSSELSFVCFPFRHAGSSGVKDRRYQ